MGLFGEALFLFLGEFKNASQMGPDRFVASPDNQDGAWKRGMISLEGRRS